MKNELFNIINVYTVTFDQFNPSLMNKSVNSFKNDSSTHTVRSGVLMEQKLSSVGWMTEAGVSVTLVWRRHLSQMNRFSVCSVSFGQFHLLWFSISTVWSVVDLQQRRVFEMWDPIGHWHQISANNLQRFTSRRMWQEIQIQCVYEVPKALWAQIFSWS